MNSQLRAGLAGIPELLVADRVEKVQVWAPTHLDTTTYKAKCRKYFVGG
jgi:hypothetical protein